MSIGSHQRLLRQLCPLFRVADKKVRQTLEAVGLGEEEILERALDRAGQVRLEVTAVVIMSPSLSRRGRIWLHYFGRSR